LEKDFGYLLSQIKERDVLVNLIKPERAVVVLLFLEQSKNEKEAYSHTPQCAPRIFVSTLLKIISMSDSFSLYNENQWCIYGGVDAGGFHLLPKKYFKTSNFKHISNIIILVCLFNKI
jgi:hypothetical protein